MIIKDFAKDVIDGKLSIAEASLRLSNLASVPYNQADMLISRAKKDLKNIREMHLELRAAQEIEEEHRWDHQHNQSLRYPS
jgi:hypothetical protein